MRISDWSSDVCSSDLTLHLWGHAVQKLFANTRGTGMTSRFDAVYRRSLDDPEGFWGEAAEDVRWYRTWDRVLDDDNMPFRSEERRVGKGCVSTYRYRWSP